jgi:hypothetical protein
MPKIPRMSMPLPNRLVLVPDQRPRPARQAVRRYRLARLDLRDPVDSAGERFGHLKRVYD